MASERRTDNRDIERSNLERSNLERGNAGSGPEHTRSGDVYTPAADIFESEGVITVLADMPGVRAKDLEIDLRDNVLTLRGAISEAGNGSETDVLREYRAGTFFRRFTVAESIDQSKIDAKLSDGVLRLELPKVERAKPRQIAVKTS
jgi:HSP20 family protein